MTIQKPSGSKLPGSFSLPRCFIAKYNLSSDGPQPHFITVEFPSKVAIQKLSIFLCFPLDDSYTPSTMCIRAGTGPADLQDVRVVTLEKPDGWITFDISSEAHDDGEGL
jgi:anaphase-promoting complex subunit 10